jgi:D-alanyl-D-alanine carboxypeptidase
MQRVRTFMTFLLAGAALGLPAACEAPPSEENGSVVAGALLERRLSETRAELPELPGLAVWVEGDEGSPSRGGAFGDADPDGRAMTAQTPVRTASNTKTYVAAAYLRLWEQGEAPLDDPIAGLIDADIEAMLAADGYDTAAITPRHLLMHNSGMPDYADGAYVQIVFGDPSRQWTRREQIGLLVENHDPLGPPGQAFRYSDTGYLLLGHMIERTTGQPLSAAVRELLDFDGLGLDQTWWEQSETRPDGAVARAHQYLGDTATHDWNGSMDLHGGGGLIASPRDMARFMAALFRGEVFDDPATLRLMIEAPGQAEPDVYRLGVFPETIDGRDAYSHSGFWGTYAVYVPELDIAVAAVTLDQSAFATMRELAQGMATAAE